MRVRLVHLLVVLSVGASAAAASLRTSAIAVTADGTRVLAVNQDSNSISIIDSVARSKVWLALSTAPSAWLLSVFVAPEIDPSEPDVRDNNNPAPTRSKGAGMARIIFRAG